MKYAIEVNPSGVITAQYSGGMQLAAPWVAITQAQYAAIVPGSKWSGSEVLAPAASSMTHEQQLAAQVQALISAGIQISSTGTPALNGRYSVDAAAQADFQSVISYINVNGKFPGSGRSFVWYDMDGKPHEFPSTADFVALYSAGLDFVMDCRLAADAGAGSLPKADITIP